MTEKEQKLKKVLDQLEVSSHKIVETQGYNRIAERLRILEELIKEQVRHANSRPTTRPIR
jgi:hypothetical protein